MSRRALNVLLSMPERYRFIRGMVSWIGFPQTALLFERAPRSGGVTKYPFTKMALFALDAITSFTIRPLRAAFYLGLAIGTMAIIALVYVFISWLTGQSVAGWTSLMVVVLLLGSAQLFMIGLLGEYLGRLYMETKRRPLFIVEDVVCTDTRQQGVSESQR